MKLIWTNRKSIVQKEDEMIVNMCISFEVKCGRENPSTSVSGPLLKSA